MWAETKGQVKQARAIGQVKWAGLSWVTDDKPSGERKKAASNDQQENRVMTHWQMEM